MAATSATAEPEISAKNSEVPILTMAKPPLMKPNRAEAKAIRRRDKLDEFMMAPAKMNNGMDRSGKLVAPVNMVMAALSRESMPPCTTMATMATTPSEIPMGTLIRISASRPRNMRTEVMIASPSEFLFPFLVSLHR